MDQNIYYKDGVARVVELLKDAFGDQFKAYFNGETEPLSSQLPCVMVSETEGNIVSDATGFDKITESIQIIIVVNKEDDIGAPPEQDLTEFKLRKMVKGQDPTTAEYLPNTVMYAIRKHITMQDSVLSQSIQTVFGVNQLSDETLTQEAYVTITLTRLARVEERE